MKHPFCLPTLQMSCAATGASGMFAASLPADKRSGQAGGRTPPQRSGPAAPRRPIVGEALIDNDGIVWLVESVQPQGDGHDFVTNVARVTRTEATATTDQPVSHHFTRPEFEGFCSAKGIVLRGG